MLVQAAACTARAAQWVREIAGRQTEPEHAVVLERFAAAVACTGIDLDPNDAYLGGVNWETRYRLDGYVLLGARRTERPIRLTTIEALVIGAVGALALALPAAVMFDTADLPRLCAVIDHALTTARLYSPAATAGAGDPPRADRTEHPL
ncbi:hypothetical protein AB0442_31755 [Kitasatospora sp. NPDC085895]|uniref:hypothetical protein n=1 Tax=Kitasatospora sp. NPDC085895 TaxID=3155057 RepID=UPI003450E733